MTGGGDPGCHTVWIVNTLSLVLQRVTRGLVTWGPDVYPRTGENWEVQQFKFQASSSKNGLVPSGLNVRDLAA